MKRGVSETPKAFFVWLDRRLEELGLNDNRLASKAGISNSVISKARSGLQPIGFDACKKLASPLGVTDEFILRLAGHLSADPLRLGSLLENGARRLGLTLTQISILVAIALVGTILTTSMVVTIILMQH